MIAEENLYFAPEDLYRIGNATSPLFNKIRPLDLDLVEINGVTLVISNHKVASVYNKTGLQLAPLTGWVWEIKAGTPIPPGLVLIKDPSPEGHYTIKPAQNMSLHEYLGLMEKLVIHCRKVFKKNS